MRWGDKSKLYNAFGGILREFCFDYELKFIEMKNILYILIAGILVLSSGCESEDTASVSRITYYPIFEIEGDQYVSVVAGNNFTDPGVVAFEGETEIDVETTGTVDTNTPGVYTLTYSATNSDGFAGTTTRLVAVTSEDVSGTDLSGDWVSISTSFSGASYGQTMTITKLADGLYSASDSYAHPNADQPVVFVHTGGSVGIIQTVPASIFGVAMFGNIALGPHATNPNAELTFEVDLPAFAFSTAKQWVTQATFDSL